MCRQAASVQLFPANTRRNFFMKSARKHRESEPLRSDLNLFLWLGWNVIQMPWIKMQLRLHFSVFLFSYLFVTTHTMSVSSTYMSLSHVRLAVQLLFHFEQLDHWYRNHITSCFTHVLHNHNPKCLYKLQLSPLVAAVVVAEQIQCKSTHDHMTQNCNKKSRDQLKRKTGERTAIPAQTRRLDTSLSSVSGSRMRAAWKNHVTYEADSVKHEIYEIEHNTSACCLKIQ